MPCVGIECTHGTVSRESNGTGLCIIRRVARSFGCISFPQAELSDPALRATNWPTHLQILLDHPLPRRPVVRVPRIPDVELVRDPFVIHQPVHLLVLQI